MSKMLLKQRFNTDWIERMIYQDDMYQSVEDLKKAEENPKEHGRINWSVWDRIVKQGRREIDEYIKKIKNKPQRKTRTYKEIYIYNYDGQQIGHYASADEASEKMKLNKGTLQYACWKQVPYQAERIFISHTPMTIEEVIKITSKYRKEVRKTRQGGAPKKVEKWVYDYSSMKLLGHFECTVDAAQKFNIAPEAVNYYAWMKKPYKKKGLLILNEPINMTNNGT